MVSLGRMSRWTCAWVALADLSVTCQTRRRGTMTSREKEEREGAKELSRWQERASPQNHVVAHLQARPRDGVKLRVVLVLLPITFFSQHAIVSVFLPSVLGPLLPSTPLSTSTTLRDFHLLNHDNNLERRSAELLSVCHGPPPYYAHD